MYIHGDSLYPSGGSVARGREVASLGIREGDCSLLCPVHAVPMPMVTAMATPLHVWSTSNASVHVTSP